MHLVLVFSVLKRERLSVEKTERLCKWVSAHAGTPYLSGEKESDQYKCAAWLSRRRYAVKNGFKISAMEQEVLDKYGMPDLFKVSSWQVHSGSMAQAYNFWIKIHGREPQSKGSAFEYSLYRWRERKKSGESLLYKEDIEDSFIANLFQPNSQESHSNYMALNLCIWMRNQGKRPKTNSKDPTEARLAKWLSNKIQGHRGNHNTKVYESDLNIFKEFGFENIMD